MFGRFRSLNAAVLSGVTASLLVIGSAAQAAAQSKPVVVYAQPDNVRSERVAYRDLNLATAKGEKALRKRVAGAVRRVCRYETAYVGLQDRSYYICSDEAWDGANPQIAQAVQRAKDIALTGHSTLAATQITIQVSNQ